uniref:Uncharacterized protein n=1 Tax=Arundo donax TaxID=35708 RepID=A0A0A9S6E8_ARUDO
MQLHATKIVQSMKARY